MDTGVKVLLTFQIFKGGVLVRTETLSQDIIKVGKLTSSHLRIDDESVSRMHAVIEVTGPNEIHIIDLGSSRGTMVNGQKINKSRIQSGDEIAIGDTRIKLTVGRPEKTGADEFERCAEPGCGALVRPGQMAEHRCAEVER